jgi:hypothetical protein
MLTELLTGAYGDRGRPPGPKQRQKISAAVDATSAEITAHRQKFKKEMSDLTFSIIKSQRGKSGGKERAMREFERKAAKLIKVASGREQEIILKHFPNFAGNSRPQELLRTEPRRGLLEGDVEQRLAEFREQCLLILGFEDGGDGFWDRLVDGFGNGLEDGLRMVRGWDVKPLKGLEGLGCL